MAFGSSPDPQISSFEEQLWELLINSSKVVGARSDSFFSARPSSRPALHLVILQSTQHHGKSREFREEKSDSDSDGPPSLCQSSSSVDDEVMGDSTVENGLSAPAQTAPAAGHPGAHGASGSVNTRRSGQNVAGGDDSDSDSDSPPALCASSSSSDSEDMDDLEQAPPNARLGGDQGWAGAQPNAHNASSANTQQPAPSQQNGGRNFQSWGPSQAPPMMHQNFVFGGPALGVTIGPLGSGVPAMFDMLSSAMWGGDGAGMWGVDPFLAALQASLNMEQREKPKASAAALET
eukprot:3794983-Rhodomonas_salina.1